MNIIPSHYSEDKPREYCGVFGVFSNKKAALLTSRGLHALQHRGQEAAGVVTFDDKRFHAYRSPGLVGSKLFREQTLRRLKGDNAIGHVRYGTVGDGAANNIQPLFADIDGNGVALCHNGQFNNASKLRRELAVSGAIFQTTADTEVMLHLMARSASTNFVDKFIDSLRKVSGGYALLSLTANELIGARDKTGIRPLVLGKIINPVNSPAIADGSVIFPKAFKSEEISYVLASETCALDAVGAEFVRDIEPGEVVSINKDGIKSYNPFYPNGGVRPRICAFEYIYFSRPDSVIDGKSVYTCRVNIGKELAKQCPVSADLVAAVPDSGVPAALGYSAQSGIPFEIGIVRNHYVGRTFIQPTQAIRESRVEIKHSPNKAILAGKRVILVDDSIVRGTTSAKLAKIIFAAGAKEVHFRIASPQIRHIDCYGIDVQDPDKLIAAKKHPSGEYISNEELAQEIGVNSVGFVSIDGLYNALGYEKRNDQQPQLTDHYFTGEYPIGRPEKFENNSDRDSAPLLTLLEGEAQREDVV